MGFLNRLSIAGRVFGSVVALSALMASAAPPAAEKVFPAETVALLSISDPNVLRDNFYKTQLGQLVQDESMAKFARHLRDEAVNQIGDVERRLAVTVDDLFDAAGGEVAIGVIHRDDARAALVLTLDVSGKQTEADALLAKAEQGFIERGSKKSTREQDGVTVTKYDVPPPAPKPGETPREPLEIFYFQVGELLVAVDDPDEVGPMIAAARNGAPQPLSGAKVYQQIQQRVAAEAQGDRADGRWFVDPFGFDAARQSMQMPELIVSRNDLLSVLGENGFRAIEGAGGIVSFALDTERDLVHRSAVYAPGNPSAGLLPSQRFTGAMRIADAPNRKEMGLQPWAPRGTATYHTFNLNIKSVFDNIAPLFDEVAGYEDAFKTTLEGFEKDPFGPKIKIRDQIIAHLGSRVTVVTDYNLPVSPDCQRYLFVLEVKNEQGLREPLDKLMEKDGAELRKLRGVPYWEVIPEEEEDVDLAAGLPEFDDPLFDDPLLDDGLDVAESAGERHSAVCLHDGRLIIASDVEFLEYPLFGPQPNESLAGSEDFQHAFAQLGKLAPWERAAWSFSRMDETFRPAYELIRTGKLPESQTFFGHLVNEALTTAEDEEKGIVRKQRLDGSTMPSYELARRYFGPAVRALRTDDDGWVLVGVLLNKANQ